MHSQGVVHRDVKPENVVLKNDDVALMVKLADFGLARFCNGGCYSLVCTPQYRAPEIWFQKDATRSKSNSYNELVDTWSAGIVLFTMLAGQAAFYDDDLEHQVCTGNFPFEESFREQPFLDMHQLICCLVVVDPAIRFSSEEARNVTLTSNYA